VKTFTKREAAEYLGISLRSLEAAMQHGRIGFYRLTSRPTFGQQHLDDFMQSREVKPKVQRMRKTA
jgi:excisionase family DNA binding protein